MTARNQRRQEAAKLEKHLADLNHQLAKLEQERVDTKRRLEALRQELTICPKCGRDRDFLADEGGFLAHVLEDPEDTELLTAGKPLFCPACGEVFLYQGAQKPTTASLKSLKKSAAAVKAESE